MSRNSKKTKLNTEVIISSETQTTVHIVDQLHSSDYPACELPKFYFDLALLKLERRLELRKFDRHNTTNKSGHKTII